MTNDRPRVLAVLGPTDIGKSHSAVRCEVNADRGGFRSISNGTV